MCVETDDSERMKQKRSLQFKRRYAMSDLKWNMEEKIAAIREIAVVDDKPENIVAAKNALVNCLPNTVVRTFSSAGEIVVELMFLNYRPTLVLTDLDIEEEDTGFKVNMAAWGNGIPAVVVTAKDCGNHGINTSISMLNGRFSNARKDDPETWCKVIDFILKDEVYAVHYAIMGFGRRDIFSNEIADTFDAFARFFLR